MPIENVLKQDQTGPDIGSQLDAMAFDFCDGMMGESVSQERLRDYYAPIVRHLLEQGYQGGK